MASPPPARPCAGATSRRRRIRYHPPATRLFARRGGCPLDLDPLPFRLPSKKILTPADPRAPLIRKLARYRPIDEADFATAQRVIDFVSEHPNCFQRSLSDGHVTGSAWVVDESGRRVLLTHHRKLNLWLQLGGHADGDADPLQVALREAREESGISGISPASEKIFDLDIHPIAAHGADPAHVHYDIRFAFRAHDDRFTVGEESYDLAWIDIDRIADRTREASMLRMAAKWKAFSG